MKSTEVVILGAGPAGLTAGYDLVNRGVPCVVLERDSVVGGLAKTVDYKGFLFDLGGHRFYTKVDLVEKMWHEVLGDDFLERPRLSRIYYRSKFFHYPLDLGNVIEGLGPLEVLRCGASFVQSRLFPQRPEHNFTSWVSNRFGSRLFNMFFKSYTEKVWGVECDDISADWAAQRIRGLSFSTLAKNVLSRNGNGNGKNQIKTLIRQFHYPRRGPGMMWTRTAELIEQRGGNVVTDAPIERIVCEPGRVVAVEAAGQHYEANSFISTLAIRDLFAMMTPKPPEDVVKAAGGFRYRDFITVGFIIRGRNLFPDNWIYVHDPAVKVGRIQNYTNWSPEMSPDPSMTSLGMEYFCFEGDDFWRKPDEELVALAARELAQLGLVKAEDILDGKVVRVPKAYPIYDHDYRERLQVIRDFLETMPNLQLAGRNGMHRYNNQDHSMLTAMMAARNVLGGSFDPWQFHGDSEYLEEGVALSMQDRLDLEATPAAAAMAARAR